MIESMMMKVFWTILSIWISSLSLWSRHGIVLVEASATTAADTRTTCAQSDDACLPPPPPPPPTYEDDPDCYDDRPHDCPRASYRGECFTMFESTRPVCRKSCWMCVNGTELRLEGISEDEIQRRYLYSRTDWGPLPSFPSHPNPRPEVLLTQEIVVAMDVYARQYPPSSVSTCRNNRAECPYWAATGYCDNNQHWEYMILECPLACRYCDQQHVYQQCHEMVVQRQQQYEATGPTPVLKSMRKWKKRLLDYSASISSTAVDVLAALSSDASPTTSSKNPYEWAVQLDDFLTHDERSKLTEFAQGLPWTPSSAAGYDLNSTLSLYSQTDYQQPQRVRRTSSSAFCSYACLQQMPVLKTVLKRLFQSILQITLQLLEKPIEFVSFNAIQTFARHQECRFHDQWKVGGYRVATAYVGLGNESLIYGFPDHNWRQVKIQPNQLLLWPHVQPSQEQMITCNSLKSEVLATPGTSYGMLIHIRLYPHDEVLPELCRS